MTEPTVTVLGVYRPLLSEETWREQWQVTEDDNATREHLDGLVFYESIQTDAQLAASLALALT
jgi:hypothetical protein